MNYTFTLGGNEIEPNENGTVEEHFTWVVEKVLEAFDENEEDVQSTIPLFLNYMKSHPGLSQQVEMEPLETLINEHVKTKDDLMRIVTGIPFDAGYLEYQSSANKEVRRHSK